MMNLKTHLLLALFLLPLFVVAQSNANKQIISDAVQLEREGVRTAITPVQIFDHTPRNTNEFPEIAEATDQADAFMVNPNKLEALLRTNASFVELEVPRSNGTNMTLELIESNIFTPDFEVVTSDGQVLDYIPGKHFKGILKGDPNAVVAISIYEEEVMGLITTDQGNIVIAKLPNRNGAHIIYNDKNLNQAYSPDCGTEDDGVVYHSSQLTEDPSRAAGDCVRVYIEVDDDIVTGKGGAVGATNYVTGLFNQSIALYSNESINMSISQIFTWTTNSPYGSTSSSVMLSQFQNNTGAFNGDIGHLVSYQAGGGIAAGFSGICNADTDESLCFSNIASTYSNVPTYSYSVFVISHEMGHLLGSRHTHACVWNGNGTAIDGCSGFTEGSCALPPNPPGGGTIMSYCPNASVGVNFNLGFGPQPGAVIRNTIINASCLNATCGNPPPGGYCDAQGNNTSYEYIQQVQFSNVNNNSGDDGGYGDYTNLTANVNQGSTYPITLSPGFVSGSYTEFWAVWIDYDGDETFDSSEQVASGSSNSAITANVLIPSSSSVGTTRMRVVMQYSVAPSACGSFTYGEVEDYTINISAAANCNAPSSMILGGITSNSVSAFWNASAGAINYTLRYRVPGGAWTNLTATGTSTVITGLSPATTYEVQIRANCSGGSSNYSPTLVVTTLAPSYCSSSAGSQAFEYIQRVQVGSINNNSGNNNGYADFTAQSTSMTGGGTYSITLVPGFVSSPYNEYWSVWIDFNQNGVFDTNERVVNTASSSTITANISVPTSASAGNTRMRVSMSYGSVPPSCGTFTYGEVEDYTISIGTSFDAQAGSDLRPTTVPIVLPEIIATPNPFRESLQVDLQQIRSEMDYVLTISNALGQIVYRLNEIDQRSLQIPTHDLENGLYFIRLSNGDGIIEVQKVVKQ